MNNSEEKSLEIFYDFTIDSPNASNTKVDIKSLINCNHEYELSCLITKLHKNYKREFESLFHIQYPPKDSLNRFLYQQLTISNRKSRLISSPEDIIELDTLEKEIKTGFPLLSKFKPKTPRWKLEKNIKQCITICSRYSLTSNQKNSRKILEILLHSKLKDEQFYNEFIKTRLKIYDLFSDLLSDKIKKIKNYLFKELQKLVVNFDEIKDGNSINNDEKVKVSVDKVLNKTTIEFKLNKLKLTNFHFEKLKALFDLNNSNLNVKFEERLFCLLNRYQTFFKCDEIINEGYGMQAALPSYVFKCLNEVFEVKQEMFASPFNCYFRTYCSAFYDTDACFGSLGSFFDFEPSTHGSFQCNPPFTEEVIECMADRIDFLLETSKFALSFIVFIPEWLDPPTPGLVKMEKSHHMRVNFNIENGKHKYVSGSQYINNSSSSCFYSAAHNTRVFFLQNQSGYEMFTPTIEKLKMLKESMHFS